MTLDHVVAFAGVSRHRCETLLSLFCDANVLEQLTLLQCSKHESVTFEPDVATKPRYCDQCDRNLNSSDLIKTTAYKVLIQPSANSMSKKKVFVSHSSADKEFVRRLVDDLKKIDLPDVWFDEQSIAVGDSIPQEIEKGLKDADYVIVVLSPNSVDSPWVRLELDATHMSDDTLVLPVLIDDCEIPTLLKARKYADFRGESNYDSAFKELAEVLTNEQVPLPPLNAKNSEYAEVGACVKKLNELSRGALRRWITREQRFDRDRIITLWRDLLAEEMENDHRRAPLSECVSILISRMINADRHAEFLEELCNEVNP